MRENCTYGSEGGGPGNRLSLPLSLGLATDGGGRSSFSRAHSDSPPAQGRWGVRLKAHAIVRGESPLQDLLGPVTKCNCVAVRRGGEQQEVNDQSVT
jgi:hypothetical protein